MSVKNEKIIFFDDIKNHNFAGNNTRPKNGQFDDKNNKTNFDLNGVHIVFPWETAEKLILKDENFYDK